MVEFIIGTILVVTLWFFLAIRKKKSIRAFNYLAQAEGWFVQEGIKSASVHFTAYDDAELLKHPGAAVIVGTGDRSDGALVSFALEVVANAGVVEAVYLEPYGIATDHRTGSKNAKLKGAPLIEVMQEMAREHREKYKHINQSVDPNS